MSKLVPKLRFKEFSGEWEEKSINDIANRYDNLRIPITASDRINGTTPYYGANGIQSYVEGYTHDGEFVLLAEDGANDLKNYPVHYVNGKIWVNNHAHVLQAKEGISNNLFLNYAIKNINFEPYLVGGGRAKLNANIMMKIIFPIPTPKEQQKIANTLSSLDNLIEAQQRKVEALKKHKKGLMQQLFPAEGANVPKLRFKEFSGEWEEKKLGDIGDILTGTTPSTKKDEYYKNGIYPWVTPTDITEKKDISYSSKLLTEKGLNAGRFVPKNSLLVTCIASIGKNAILRKDGSCNQQINSITPYKDYDVTFLYYLIEEKNHILKENAGQGGMALLNKNDFSNLKFYFPKKEEQQKIANTLSSLDSLIEAQKRKVEALKKHKKGLMQQMFVSGEG